MITTVCEMPSRACGSGLLEDVPEVHERDDFLRGCLRHAAYHPGFRIVLRAGRSGVGFVLLQGLEREHVIYQDDEGTVRDSAYDAHIALRVHHDPAEFAEPLPQFGQDAIAALGYELIGILESCLLFEVLHFRADAMDALVRPPEFPQGLPLLEVGGGIGRHPPSERALGGIERELERPPLSHGGVQFGQPAEVVLFSGFQDLAEFFRVRDGGSQTQAPPQIYNRIGGSAVQQHAAQSWRGVWGTGRTAGEHEDLLDRIQRQSEWLTSEPDDDKSALIRYGHIYLIGR